MGVRPSPLPHQPPVAQWTERLASNQGAARSSRARGATDPVAQRQERRIFNPRVGSSTLPRITFMVECFTVRTCPGCGLVNETRQSKCRDCYNEYMRAYLRARWEARRSRGIELLGGVCVDCSTTQELQFDHVDPREKSFTMADQTTCSKARFLRELRKCTLRCRPCHIERTRSQQGVPHGGGLTGRHNCYCPLCREKKNEYARNWKRVRRATSAS